VRLAPLSLAHFFERNPEYIPEEMLRCDGVFEFAGTRLKRTDICWGAPISIIGAVETLDSGAHVLNFDTKHCPAPGKISGAEKRSWLVVLVASEPKPDEE
jgi:hypothetical protein